jgi:TP901 family phage tail tape measure protein
MSAMTTILRALITADASKLKTELTTASAQLEAFGNKATKTGKVLTKRLTLPMIAIGGAAIKSAVEFESSMTQIETLVGRSAEEVAKLSENVKELSGETAKSPQELAQAMFFITSAGLDAATATDALEYSAKAAAIGLGETASVADAVTNAINGYGAANISAMEATDVLAKTVEQGKAAADELAPTFGRLVPLAATLGVEFEEVGGGLAFLTRSSGNAAESSTQLAAVFRTFVKPSKQAAELLENIGYNLTDLRADIEQDFLGTLIGLRTRLEENGFELSNVFENSRALVGALQLTARGGAEASKVFGELENSAGKVDAAFERYTETTEFQLRDSLVKLQTTLLDLGNALIPIIVPAIEALAKATVAVADVFRGMPDILQKVTLGFVALAAASGPALTILGGGAKVASRFSTSAAGMASSLGAAKGAGVVGRLGALAKFAKPAVPLMVGLGVATFAATKIFNGFKKRAQEAKDRMSLLRKEFADASDPTESMTVRVAELAKKLGDLNKKADKADDSITGFRGSTVLMSELIKRDVTKQFSDLNLEMTTLVPLIHEGTDKFHELGDQTKNLVRDEDAFVKKLKEADAAILGVTYRLAEQIEAGEITTKQAREIMIAIDETADAFDDYTKAIERQAEAYLTSDEGIINVTNALGLMGAELLDAAGDTMTYTQAQKEIDKALQVTDDAINGNIGQWLGYGTQAKEIVVPVSEEVAESQEEIEARLKETEEALEAVREQFDLIVQSMRASIDSAYAYDLAMLEVKDAVDGMKNAMIVLADEEATLDEKTKAVTTASLGLAESFGDVAEAMVGTSEAEILDQFQELGDYLNEFKDTLPEDEFERLNKQLAITQQAALDMHGTQIMIDLEIGGTYDPTMLNFLESVQNMGGIDNFASSVAGWLGATPMATGGIVTQPTLSLIGEAGPEAVVPLDKMGGMGGTTVVNVNVEGNVMAEYDLAETIQNQLLRIKGRNASLEFG